MKLHNKLDWKEQSQAVSYMVKTKWWKLIEEFLVDEKINLIKNITLKRGIKNGKAYELTETQIDQYRKQLVDIEWFLNIPGWYIEEALEEAPKEELEESLLDDVLNTDVLS